MDLDRRARNAANELNRSVSDIDLGSVHAEVLQQGAKRRHRDRTARAGIIGAAAVFLIGTFAIIGLAGGDGGRDGTNGNLDERVATELGGERSAVEAGYASKVFSSMPAGALDGKSSWRLPVLAQPQHDLEDGDVITLFGRGFEPNESLGIVMCTSEADIGNAGATACQLSYDGSGGFGAVTLASADPDGNVVASFAVRRFVTTPDGGKVDCASGAERCLVAIAAASNYDRSGGAYIDFAAAPDFPEPSMTISPDGPVVPGAPLSVSLTDMVPRRSVRLQQCVEDLCVALADVKVGADGSGTQSVSLQPSIKDPVSGRVVPCEDRCVLRINGIGPAPVLGAMASHAPLPDDIALTFTTDVASAPLAEQTTTTAAPAAAPEMVPAETAPAETDPGTETTGPTASSSTPATIPDSPADPAGTVVVDPVTPGS